MFAAVPIVDKSQTHDLEQDLEDGGNCRELEFTGLGQERKRWCVLCVWVCVGGRFVLSETAFPWLQQV